MNDGIVMVSDSRTNAGLDNVSTYKKMFTYSVGDRSIIIVTSGNLSTSQHVFKTLENDIDSSNPSTSLNLCKNFDEIAEYVGQISLNHSKTDGISINTHLGSNFLIGGQISGQEPALLMVYPDSIQISLEEHLQFKTPFFSDLSSKWSEGLRNLFKELPKFDWEKD